MQNHVIYIDILTETCFQEWQTEMIPEEPPLKENKQKTKQTKWTTQTQYKKQTPKGTGKWEVIGLWLGVHIVLEE